LIISDALKKKLTEDMAAIAILQYVKDNERGMSKDRVAREMHERNICSRPTTLKIIDSLIQAEILKNRGGTRKKTNDLVVNEAFQFEEIMQESFDNYIKQAEKSLEPFATLIKKNIIKQHKARKDPKGHQVHLDV